MFTLREGEQSMPHRHSHQPGHDNDHDHAHHDHGHHHHGHAHGATGNIKVAFFLNLLFTLIEIGGGFYTNSVAILSDALHDLGDSLSLGLAWYFQKLSGKNRDATFSYGYRRFSLLGAVINSLILVIGSVFVLQEAIPRLFNPQSPDARGMLGLAVLGVAFNGAAMLRLQKGHSLNERAISLHLLEDVMGWVAVLVASVVMLLADVPVLDPALSVLITLYVLFNVYRNLRDSFRILLQAVPDNVRIEQVRARIATLDHVADIHDVHLWTLDGEYNILTVHLRLKEVTQFTDAIRVKERVKKALSDLPIQHITVEIEGETDECALQDC
jgi:cobalt-zinc-cadmium efflux system protein